MKSDCVMTDAWVSMGEKNTKKKKNKSTDVRTKVRVS